MDPPRIRYALTEDGVRIAYWMLGNGPALVCTPYIIWGDLEREWRVPALRQWFSRLSRSFRVIRFDARDSGLSGQTVQGQFDLPRVALDVEAVLAACDERSVGFLAEQGSGLIVVLEFARRNPGATLFSVFVSPVNDYRAYMERSASSGYQSIAARDWPLYSRMAAETHGFQDSESRAAFADMVRETGSPGSYATKMAAVMRAGGFTGDLLDAPALVMHSRGVPIPEDLVRAVAGTIPEASLRLFDGTAYTLAAGDQEQFASEIERFAHEALRGRGGGPAAVAASGFRTILFTDVVASTPLLAQLKDAKMRAVMHDHDEVLTTAVARHGGRVIKTIGDAFMAEFAVPSAAVEAAIAAQRGIRERFAAGDVPIRLRIGINAGEPIEEAGDLHGASVVIAKRLESAAGDNGILVSDVVKQAVAGKDFEFEDRGLLPLKGLDEPVRAWAVGWD